MARKALSKKTRFEVFKRDGFSCQYCGAHPPGVLLQVDHIKPVASGGGNEMDNLITACQPCNLGKSANSLDAVPQALADKAAETREREQQIRGYSEVMSEKRSRIDDESWEVAELYMAHFNEETIRKDHRLSIKQFLESLPVDEVMQAMEIALAKKPYSKDPSWRYFCGICWNKIKRPEGARA